MNPHVDLRGLREITEGDAALERELFAIFIASSGECLQALAASQYPDKTEIWRQQAHALKGAALNLGAARLGELARQAQDNSGSGPIEKNRMLLALQAEFKQVCQFIGALHPLTQGKAHAG